MQCEYFSALFTLSQTYRYGNILISRRLIHFITHCIREALKNYIKLLILFTALFQSWNGWYFTYIIPLRYK